MFVGSILKNISVSGYVLGGLFDESKLDARHDELVKEMQKRGFAHASPLQQVTYSSSYTPCIDYEENVRELSRRCVKCRSRIEKRREEYGQRNSGQAQ